MRLRWRKRLWRCAEPPCPVGTWTQTSQQIRPRAVLTERARAEVCRRVGWEAVPVARIAAELGVGWATVMRAVREHGQPLIDDSARLGRVTAFGVDETAFLAATSTHATLFVTGMVDLARPRLLDVVPGRSGAALAGWVAQQPTGWRRRVRVAAFDPFRGYAAALTNGLPEAVRVLDAFHVTRLGLAALDDVRRRVQQSTLGRRGHRDDPLYRIRRRRRRAAESLTETGWARLQAGLDAGDPNGEATTAWMVAQELILLYRRSRDLPDAKHRLYRLLVRCADSNIPELHRLARTLDGWRHELLAYFTTGRVSNGSTEAVNLLIKRIKRIGFGFRNFDNYRLRLLLHCGVDWQTAPTTPVRGRPPHLTA